MKTTRNLFAVLGIAVGGFLLSPRAQAAMDDFTFHSAVTIAGVAANTNAFVLRGEVAGVAVIVNDAASRTNTVAITSEDGQTIFSKSCDSGTNFYPIAVPLFSNVGVQINSSTVKSTTNSVYSFAPVASRCTSVVTGADANQTNTVTVKVMVKQ